MKKIVRLVSFTTAALLTFGLMAGCSGKSESGNTKAKTSTSAATQQKKQSAEITVWGGLELEKGPKQVIEGFNKKFPDIKVQYEYVVNDDSGNIKIDTALMAGQKIDAYFTYGLDKLIKRVNSGSAEDMDAFTQKKALISRKISVR